MPPRAEPIIEFVGVPGAGKSTIARAFRPLLPNAQGLQLPRRRLGGSPALFYRAAALLLSLRPFAANDIHRTIRLLEAQRVYAGPRSAPMLFEQGIIQRLWAMLADRVSYGEAALDALVTVLGRAAPDVIVRVRTAPELAAMRIRERPDGNSRYEHMDAGRAATQLIAADLLYDRLVGLYRRHSAARFIELSGADPVQHNVARLEAFIGQAQQVGP